MRAEWASYGKLGLNVEKRRPSHHRARDIYIKGRYDTLINTGYARNRPNLKTRPSYEHHLEANNGNLKEGAPKSKGGRKSHWSG